MKITIKNRGGRWPRATVGATEWREVNYLLRCIHSMDDSSSVLLDVLTDEKSGRAFQVSWGHLKFTPQGCGITLWKILSCRRGGFTVSENIEERILEMFDIGGFRLDVGASLSNIQWEIEAGQIDDRLVGGTQ